MTQAIELNSVRRGYDPRDFTLVAAGGAGPLFACDIALELEIPRVLVPPHPGIVAATGLLATDLQHELFENWWFSQNPKRVVVIECGAGTAIPSVRRFSEQLQREGATLIRVNPRESEGPRGTLSLPCGAAEGLHLIA